jgi:serine/threonine protein kinase
LVYAVDFFREGASYYKINEKIDTTSLTLKKISSLPLDKINVIARSVCHSLGILHSLNIIHGDLKPENILIKETPVGYTGKLIDFDDSYYSEHPPRDKENLVGTPEYYSPELAAYIQDEDDEIPGDTLTLASDVFTLGVILTEYFTGEKPCVDKNIPIWAAVKEGRELRFCKKVPSELDALLRSMMAKDPKDRPAVKKVQTMLKDIQDGKRLKPDSTPDSGGLRGHILANPPISPPEAKTVSETRVELRGGILKNKIV